MTKNTKFLGSAFFVALLLACSGGGGGGTAIVDSAETYKAISDSISNSISSGVASSSLVAAAM